MRSVPHDAEAVYVGLDVHKDSITAGVLQPGRQTPELERFFHDEVSVRRFLDRLGDRRRLRVCYEAGPTGFELARLLEALRVDYLVAAPSLIPRAPGDRVKTDRRDARRLTRLFQGGQLTAIHVPTRQEEAVRDLCRTRTDMVIDLNGLGIDSRSSCCVTTTPIEAAPNGPTAIPAGSPGSASRTPRCGPPSATTGVWSPPAPPSCAPSKPTSSPGATGNRSPTRCTVSAPIAASPTSARSASRLRSPTGDASP